MKFAACASERIIDSIIADIPKVKPYEINILVTGKSSFYAVFERIQDYDFHLPIEEFRFCLSWFEFLGHIIDKDDLHPNPEKTHRCQLQINYHGRFDDFRKMHPVIGMPNGRSHLIVSNPSCFSTHCCPTRTRTRILLLLATFQKLYWEL